MSAICPKRLATSPRSAGKVPRRTGMGNDGVMADVAQRVGADLLTVGVEEEYLLVDPATGAATPAVEAVIAEVPPDLRGQVQQEFQSSQIEIGSPPGLELSALAPRARHAPRGPVRGGRTGRRADARRRHRPGERRDAGPGRRPAVPPDERAVRRRSPPAPASTACTSTSACRTRRSACRCSTTCARGCRSSRPRPPTRRSSTAATAGTPRWRSMLWNRWPTVGPTP